jgi:hypothetical protein
MTLTPREVVERIGIDLAPTGEAAVDHAALRRLANLISAAPSIGGAAPAKWDDPLFWDASDTPERRSQNMAIGNAINFRFWVVEGGEIIGQGGVLDGDSFTGSMYMWRALRRAIGRGVPVLDAAFLAAITDQQFDEVFSDDDGRNPLDVGRDQRIANLRDLGGRLVEDWSGQFLNAARASGHSIVEFSRLSRTFRAWDDPVQKLTMVNAIMHAGSDVYTFDDDPLPGIDYHLVKQLVRQGAVVPSQDVARKMLRNELLTSDEASGLRRACLSALVALSTMTGVSGAVLDNRYWLNRANCTDLAPVCTNPATAARCPFLSACDRRVGSSRPLELTRYY